MALTRQQKSAQLAELTKKFREAKSIVFSHYIGLKVSDVSALRAKLKRERAEMKVCKKTLIYLAAKEASKPEIRAALLPGAVACIFSHEDPVTGASIAFKFGKDHEQVKLIGAIFDGKLLDQREVLSFAALPSRQTLLAIFAGMLRTPLRSFASQCASPLSGFARALAEVAKKRAASPSA